MGLSKIISKWEVYSNTSLPKERRKISNKPLKLTPKETRKRIPKQTIPNIGRREKVMKIRA